MSLFRFPFAVLILFLTAWSLHAQSGGPLNVTVPVTPPAPLLKPRPFTVFSDYGEGNAVANALRNSPPKLYTFDRASLRDVLRFLADDAGIPFISMQERAPAGDGGTGGQSIATLDDILVTFTMRASPFLVLESIAKANDLALVYENGVWFIRPYNDREFIGRIYRLKFTPQERVTFTEEATGGGNVQNSSSSSNSSIGSASIPNMGIQQGQSIFQVEEPAIIKEIKGMLKISSRGVTGKVAGEASVEDFPPLPANSGINPGEFRSGAEAANGEPTVTFNSDTNTIYIVGTRQQHQWVEGFLAAADQPQALIGIEVKFFETTKDPRKDLGIDWSGTLGDGGYQVRAGASAEAVGGLNSNTFNNALNTVNKLSESGSQTGIDAAGNGPYNFSRNSSTRDNTSENGRNHDTGFSGGYSAFLTPADVSFAIQAFMDDRDTSTVQYPRVLTVNNREVAISNARNEPILGSSTSNNTGGTSIQTFGIEYLPVGTQVNILPKTMPDGSVFMNVAITVSAIVDNKTLNTGLGANSYPVTSSRIYQAALQVNSGYTLAVGGLDEAIDRTTDNGVLFLKDIPGLGQLFKSKGRAQNKRNLIIFITPTVVKDRSRTTGISEVPESVVPIRPGDPTPPAFGPDGRLVGGIDGLDSAFAWISFQNELYKQISDENRADTQSIKQLEGVIRTAEMLLAEIEVLAAKFPGRADELAEQEEHAISLIGKLKATLKATKKNLF